MTLRARLVISVIFAATLSACDDCGGQAHAPADAGPRDPDAKPMRLVRLDHDAAARHDASAPSTANTDAKLAALRGKPRTTAELPTTPGAEAVLALDKTLAGASGVDLAKARAAHARITGDVEELALAVTALDAAITADARLAVPHLERARVLLALHKLADARAAVTRAKELGAPAAEVDLVKASLDWDAGQFVPAADAIRRVARESSSFDAYVRRAVLEHEAGDDALSDRLFEAAEDLCTDKNPLPLAEVHVAHGFARLDSGKPDEARAYFDEALARVPGHTGAIRGQAEAIARTSKAADAIAKLEPLAAQTKDHELLALHAKLSPAARPRAKTRLEQLLAKLPEVATPSAARFFVDVDAKRAVTLAAKDVEASPTPAALLTLARAHLAAGDAAAARTAIESALRTPVASARIDWTAARVYSRVGEAGKAGELSARARGRNARIESEEGLLTATTR